MELLRPPTTPLRRQGAFELGLSRRDLESNNFVRVRQGLYVGATADVEDPDTRIRIAAEIARGSGHLGGWAAAAVFEEEVRAHRPNDKLRVFDGRVPWPEGRGEMEPLLLCMGRHAKLAPSPGIRVLRSDLAEDDMVTRGHLRLTSAHRTAFDLARTRSLQGAVIALDRLAHLGIIDPHDFAEYVKQQHRKRGTKHVLRAIALAHRRAESPTESVTRLLWLAAGLPCPEVNFEIVGSDGNFVARVDLVDLESRLVVEYDGEEHAPAARRSRDAARNRALESLGFRILTVTSVDLATAPARKNLQRRMVRRRRELLDLPA